MKRRRLSPQETDLWKRATRDVRPFESPGAEVEAAPVAVGPAPGKVSQKKNAPPLAKAPAKRARRSASPSPFAAGDPALDRKARRGRLRPERSLDLHGLRQTAARVRLQAFLENAAEEGLRCVVVVTGKGGGGVIDRPPGDGAAPRGVLRRRFIEWMTEEPLRSLAARVAQAGPGDGGAGAFYVFLKKRAR